MSKHKIPQRLLDKGQEIVKQLIKGVSYATYNGKKLTKFNRDLISIALNRRDRLLYNLKDHTYEIMTHAVYNKFIGCRTR